MKFRTKHSPLILLLLPPLIVALADTSIDTQAGRRALIKPRDTFDARDALEPEPEPAVAVNSGARRDIPTKDAPVDGKDGKPHLGPFVETDISTGGDLSDLTLKGKPSDWKTVDGKEIPESNDGVMFDKNRERPQEGTTGLEGGVTEKERTRKAQEGKAGGKLQTQPEPPKEQPPLPHSEEQKIKSATKDSTKPLVEEEGDASYTGLDKPEDLPEKPGQDSPPVPESANKDHLDLSSSNPGSTKLTQDMVDGEDDEGIIQPFHSFVLSLAMILFSEVGDKTFLVAALMAMKHDRMVVFSAAFGALLVMTVLSAVLGHAVPSLIPRRVTSFAAAGLFFVFGAKLLHEGMQMDPNEGVGAEMSEVEQELALKEKELGRNRGNSMDPYTLEMGLNGRRSRSRSRFPSPPRSPSQSPVRSSPGASAVSGFVQGFGNLVSLLLSPAWVQTFVMTFLGEWGDRSQIATIAMAAGQDYWWVTLGAMVGHAICTGAAVIGGRAIAGRVSLKVVTVGGAVAFLAFGFIYFFEAVYG